MNQYSYRCPDVYFVGVHENPAHLQVSLDVSAAAALA
jgi:hypothetical protein